MDEIPLEKWLTPESLSEIREQWAAASTDQERDAWKQIIPIEALERAIAPSDIDAARLSVSAGEWEEF